MEPSLLTSEARASSWRVFALVLVSAAYFFQSSGHNEAARFDQIRAFTEHGEWWIDRFYLNTADTVRANGHTFPDKAPGTTLLGLVPWAVLRSVLRLAPASESQQLVLVTYGMTVLMSALPTALTAMLMLRFLARNGWTVEQAILVSLGYGLGTTAFPFATTFFGHQLAAFFAFASFYLVWSARWSDRATILRLRVAGLLIGFLPVVELPGAIASGLIGAYAILVLGPRRCFPLILGAIAGLASLPLYDLVAFGDPTLVGYDFHGKEGSGFQALRFSLPRLDALAYITFKPQRGLFYANPWLIFLLAAPRLARRAPGLGRELGLFAAIFVGFVLFNSGFGDTYVYWGGGTSVGPRYILISIPFASLLAGLAARVRWLIPLVGAAILASALLMLPAAAVDPRLPYEASDPFLSFYLPLYSRALFSMNPFATFGKVDLFERSGAFNLGRAAGLPHDLEILPLALVWALAALSFFRKPGQSVRFAEGTAALLGLLLGLWPALPRLQPGRVREPGLCAAVSVDRVWPHFSLYDLQTEPADPPLYFQAAAPAISPVQTGVLSPTAAPSVAVTFAGEFEPEVAGWYVVRARAVGRAALYVDGMRRLEIIGDGESPQARAAEVYFSAWPHQLVVRYTTEKPVRLLGVTVALRDGPQKPLTSGLSRGACL